MCYQQYMQVVLDTNIIVGAMLRDGGASRAVLRLCLQGEVQPLIGVALFAEMEDVLSREELFRNSKLTTAERQDLFAAFLSVTQWVPIYYTWRPNLSDEADNHVIDLAIAGNAEYIWHEPNVTASIKAYTFAFLLRVYGNLSFTAVDVFCFSNEKFLMKMRGDETPLHVFFHADTKRIYPFSKNLLAELNSLEIKK